jgi:hypothetical protein
MIEYEHHRQDHRDVLMISHRYVIFLWHLRMFQLRNKLVDNLHLRNRSHDESEKIELNIFHTLIFLNDCCFGFKCFYLRF